MYYFLIIVYSILIRPFSFDQRHIRPRWQVVPGNSERIFAHSILASPGLIVKDISHHPMRPNTS